VLPDISVVWVILAVLVLAFALDRVLFKPLVRTMQEREQAVKSAMELANSATARAEAATAEFDTKLGAARAELYKQMDDRRKAAESYRADVMAKTRAEVDETLAAAKTQLEQQSAQAKAQLEKDAESLGREIARKVLGRGAAILLAAAVAAGSGSVVFAQEAAAPAHAPDQHAAGGHAAAAGAHGESEDHGNPAVEMLAKLLNFAILAGTLFYFGRGPLGEYLKNRGTQIRGDLVKAAEMKTQAAAQMAAIDQKMAALPGELEALRKTGADEVAAEEARIRAAADAERTRLLVQTQREIELHGKAAERDLVRLAADRAVTAATAEITKTMTPDDHARLVERYTEMVG
jgi:F-type H+-transporting ATPase subunit b